MQTSRRRVALIVVSMVAFSAAVLVPIAGAGTNPTPLHQENTAWRSGLPEQPSASDQQVAEMQFVSYTTTVLANEEAALQAIAAQQAAEAAARAAAERATIPTAPSTATTYQSTPSSSGACGAVDQISPGPAALAESQGVPCAWVATAVCEESGRDDPYAGVFGILEWNGFGSYPAAGAAPLDVQLGWESAHGQGPPDAPGQCHSY